MPDRKTKSISHRKAEWTVSPAPTLETCIKLALAKAPTVPARTVALDDGRELKCAAFDVSPSGGGVLLHLTVETPGEQASVVPNSNNASTETVVNVADAPIDTEYMDGDAFLYIKNDEVCMCSTHFGEGTIKLFFWNFFHKTNIRRDSTKFDLFKTVNMEKLRMLQAGKVREIRIKASAYKASASFAQRDSSALGVMGVISKYIRALCGAEHDVTNGNYDVCEPRQLRIGLTRSRDREPSNECSGD